MRKSYFEAFHGNLVPRKFQTIWFKIIYVITVSDLVARHVQLPMHTKHFKYLCRPISEFVFECSHNLPSNWRIDYSLQTTYDTFKLLIYILMRISHHMIATYMYSMC